MSDTLSPVQIEAKLRALVNDLAAAQLALARHRDLEVETKHNYERLHRHFLLSDECPKVTRGGHTTAERDAWVAEHCADAQRTYDLAVAAREAASDHLRTLRDQSMLVMALGKSVGQAYSMAGVT